MKYMLLINSEESYYETVTEQEIGELMAAYGKFSQELAESGALVSGERLQPVATATTVRVRDGKTLTTDGPFAETKEQMGGFYMIDVENLDDAIAWAARVPSATYGSVEIRPVWE
ncbi:MAG: YciI family protein [Planctomycetes bacterium]|nr:YciI family protein [Planctomycetota bacterium]